MTPSSTTSVPITHPVSWSAILLIPDTLLEQRRPLKDHYSRALNILLIFIGLVIVIVTLGGMVTKESHADNLCVLPGHSLYPCS